MPEYQLLLYPHGLLMHPMAPPSNKIISSNSPLSPADGGTGYRTYVRFPFSSILNCPLLFIKLGKHYTWYGLCNAI